MKLVDFKFSLGNKESRKALLDSLVAEANARREEWEAVFGPEVYAMKTGEVFQSVQKQFESSLSAAFPELEKDEYHGNATDEIGPHGVTVDKSFVLAEFSGKNGELIIVEAYRGLDYRNWDGNVTHAEMTDEFVVAGRLSELDLDKLFNVLEIKENEFLQQYEARPFDKEASMTGKAAEQSSKEMPVELDLSEVGVRKGRTNDKGKGM